MRRPFRPRRAAVLAAALALVGGCGGDDPPTSAPEDCTSIEGGRHTLVAENLSWDTDCLRLDQPQEIAFTVDLRDRSVDHNLSVFGPSGKAETPLERGPKRQRLDYDAVRAGRHQYVCDIHPSMEGELWVE